MDRIHEENASDSRTFGCPPPEAPASFPICDKHIIGPELVPGFRYVNAPIAREIESRLMACRAYVEQDRKMAHEGSPAYVRAVAMLAIIDAEIVEKPQGD